MTNEVCLVPINEAIAASKPPLMKRLPTGGGGLERDGGFRSPWLGADLGWVYNEQTISESTRAVNGYAPLDVRQIEPSGWRMAMIATPV